MTNFPPIAVIGRALVVPGALSPEELWQSVVGGEDLVTSVPEDRWGMSPSDVLSSHSDNSDPKDSDDRTWSDRGGYVRGFEDIFDAEGFGIDAEEIRGLDPVFQWTFHTARQALRDAGYEGSDSSKFGAVFGNLSFPSAGMAAFTQASAIAAAPGYGAEALAEAGLERPSSANRFNSGLPALLLERALGLGSGAFALDAACASSLYAIKLACDQLHDRTSDLMLAGAVNCADDLCIHLGFSALQALSKTGQTRPFHSDADGLVPAEGCGFVALKRLDDAVRDGDTIHGILRGVGLSNDGRGRGMLVPSSDGQAKAISRAFEVSGLAPTDVSLLECHATGTQVGDATEIRSSASVYSDCSDLPIGSLKSNTGHLITAAGVAGLIKVLEAMRHEVRPPTLHTDAPLDIIDESPFRLLKAAEPWARDSAPDGVLRAGVSAFGFGGNNAHLLVEEPATAEALVVTAASAGGDTSLNAPIAIVGIGVNAASAVGREEFAAALIAGTPCLDAKGQGTMGSLALKLKGLKFPPNDLKSALGQQLAILQVADEALDDSGPLPSESTGIYVGMGTDPEAARFGVRWRLATAAKKWGCSEEWMASARDVVGPVLDAAGVLGTMPNIVANRLNSQFDMAGPSFAVSAEENSGLEALAIASRALRSGEIDAAMVGAVDLSCNPVHIDAAATCFDSDRQIPGDAAVMLVLKRLSDAEDDGDTVYAVLPGGRFDSLGERLDDRPDLRVGLAPEAQSVTDLFGHAHAASGLVHVAAATLSLHHRVAPGDTPILASNPGEGSGLVAGAGPRTALVEVQAMDGLATSSLNSEQRSSGKQSVLLAEASEHCAPSRFAASGLYIFSGETTDDVLAALAAGSRDDRASTLGQARLVIVADTDDQFAKRADKARKHIEEGHPPGLGVHFRSGPIDGEMAFVFTAAGAAYSGMGAELLRALPELASPVSENFPLRELAGWAFDGTADPTPNDFLWGTSLLSQAHAQLTLLLLKLRPSAAIGYSSGESNSLYAFDVWSDMDAMRQAIDDSGMMDHELGVDFAAIARAWGTESADWALWNCLAPRSEVEALVADFEHVHVAIINTQTDVVIGGDAASCEAIVEKLGRRRCVPVSYNLACHVPEVAETFHQPWIDIHSREVTPMPGVRYYSNGVNGSYDVGRDACAEAITAQAEKTLDFPATIEAAYADGVRIFVEHGPAGACTNFISEVLSEHDDVLCIQLDRRDKNLEQVFETVAALICAGVEVDHGALTSRLALAPTADKSLSAGTSLSLSFAAHPSPITLPPRPNTSQEQALSSELDPAMGTQSDRIQSDRIQHDGIQQDGIQHMAPAPSLPPVGMLIDLTGPGQATVAPQSPPDSSPEPLVQAVPVQPVPAQPVPVQPVPIQTAPIQTVPAQPVVTPAVGAPAAIASVGVPVPTSPAEQAIRAQFDALSSMHEGFIQQQSEIHTQFLNLRSSMLGSIVQGGVLGSSTGESISTAVAGAEAATALPVSEPPAASLVADSPAVAPAVEMPVVEVPVVAAPATPVASITGGVAPDGNKIVFAPTGPTWDKEQLKIHSSGKISELFGAMFEPQDGYERQCRMPEPPLLLADRVTGLDAEAGVLGQGTMWTETDISVGDWYLNDGYMPAGFMIESGQADLMLISYMGIDLLNKGERVYRLLGCTLTYHGDLPSPGETLEYEIRINGHAKHGDVRLFFFEYDCIVNGERRLTVRDAQAGFFSYAELDDALGILWTPEQGKAELSDDARVDAPAVACTKSSFTAEEVRAFSEGRLFDCFGPGYEWAQTHTRSPKVQSAEHLFIDEISAYEPEGGPWGRGFMRCETIVKPDDWFFEGHFKNDPCMPGNFMVEACIEALSFYLAASGFATKKDGWRFQPLPDQAFDLKCRGEINPQTNHVTYEIHVEELWDGPKPTVICDVVGFVDGEAAFHAHRIGVELVPSWPLTTMVERYEGTIEPVAVAKGPDGFPFDWKAMISCAWGKPSDAFGSMYEVFDGTRQSPRLPGEPYHFITRVTSIEGDLDTRQAGMKIVCEYDIPADVWYFDENGTETMPHAVLLEAALQPCGWVASAVGSVTNLDDDLMFRNLDGTGTLLAELTRTSGVLTTHVKINSISNAGGMIIESFDVECFLGDTKVYVMDTVFGFFPPEAFDNQAGLPIKDVDRVQIEAAGGTEIDLTARPEKYCSGSVRLAQPMLLMVDRAMHAPGAGASGLGIIRGEKDVDVSEWFFKAHFFQDPVQPGSLGIEALLQLLQFFMLDTGMDVGLDEDAHFEPIMLDAPMTWKYRGQVTPKNSLISSTMEITETGSDERGPFVIGTGSLWVDGLRIYEAKNMGMRIAAGKPAGPSAPVRVAAQATGQSTVQQVNQPGATSFPKVDAPEGVLVPGPQLSGLVRDFWNPLLGTPDGWIGEDIVLGLFEQYVNRVVIPGPGTLERLWGRPAIYLGNHQVQIESLLITNLIPALTGITMTSMANAKHENRWIGQLIGALESYPGFKAFEQIVYFERDKPETMFAIVDKIKKEMAKGTRSFFLHTDGTRSQSSREETVRCSSVFMDMALELNVPIVPISFTGGLPVEPITGKAEFPVGHGRQDYWIGEPIEPDELRALPLRQRIDRIVGAINSLGIEPADDVLLPADTEFAARVQDWQKTSGSHEVFASIWQILQRSQNVSPETEQLRSAVGNGQIPTDPWLERLTSLLLGSNGQAAITAAATAAASASEVVDSQTEIVVSQRTHPQLADHVVNGVPVVPVVYVLEWFARAATQMATNAGLHLLELSGLQVLKGIVASDYLDGGDLKLVISGGAVSGGVVSQEGGRNTISLSLADARSPRLHYRCSALLGPEAPGSSSAVAEEADRHEVDAVERSVVVDPYGGVLFHGPAFQVLSAVDSPISEGTGLQADVAGVIDQDWGSESWISDPAALDGLLQLALLWTENELGGGSLPTGVAKVRILQPPSAGRYRATLIGRQGSKAKAVTDIVMVDDSGRLVAELLGIETHLLPS